MGGIRSMNPRFSRILKKFVGRGHVLISDGKKQ